VHIVYKVIPASEIYNACDPSWLYDVAVEYKERWWDAAQDELRAVLYDTFLNEFDALTGHYTRLRESINTHGLLNPIIVTHGKPIRRKPWSLPPEYGDYICESIGGSRLIIAKELGLDVPCIVNTSDNIGGELLRNHCDVLDKFHDKSYSISLGPPLKVTPTKFEHMPNSYDMGVQINCRRQIHRKMVNLAKNWNGKSTSKSGT
jgi:hypothetical protein